MPGDYFGANVTCCPPIAASTIAPPTGLTKTAKPFTKRAFAAAPVLRMTAEASAAN